MNKIKEFVKKTAGKLPKKYIVFESAPDLSDNTKAVFDEMVKRGLNKKYKFVWMTRNPKTICPKIKNVSCVSAKSFMFVIYSFRAKALISCNGFLPPLTDGQFSFYLSHGTGIKDTKDYYVPPSTLQYHLVQSDIEKEILVRDYKTFTGKIIELGYPRNDVFLLPPVDLHKFFDVDYKKIIVWYPTFRQKIEGGRTGSSHAIPVIWDANNAVDINDFLKKLGVVIVLKPHFAQDLSFIKNLDLSNIIFIDDSFFVKNDISSYAFVGSCDALLTDYSSIYFDYTLRDKPIGLVWEDYEEYEKNPGFAIDMEKIMSGGVKIYNKEDLKAFIADVAEGIDRIKEERRIIRDLSNYYTDGKCGERVVDFIVKEAKL